MGEAYEIRMRRIDKEILSIGNIERAGSRLFVKGVFTDYEFGIDDSRATAKCKGDHRFASMYIHPKKGGNVDPAVALAANLRYNDRINDPTFLQHIESVVLCSFCLKEGLSERVKKYLEMREEEERIWTRDEKAPENEEAVESELKHQLRALLMEKKMKRVRSIRFLEERRREQEQRSPET